MDRADLRLQSRVYQPNQQLQQNVDHHTQEDLEDPAGPEAQVALGVQEDPVDPVDPKLLSLVYQLNQPSQQSDQADQEAQEVREVLGDLQVPEGPVGPVVRAGLEVPVDQEGQVWFIFVLRFDENYGTLTSVHELGVLHMTPR